MATVRDPLNSVTAAGNYGNAIIFQNGKARQTAKSYAKPRQPRSPGQTAVRTITRTIMQAWPTLDDDEKNTWLAPARFRRLEPINVFQQTNFQRLAAGLDLTRTYRATPAAETPIYSGGTVEVQPQFWGATYTGGLVKKGNAVYVDGNLLTFTMPSPFAADGQFDFSSQPFLEELILNDGPITTPPVLTGLTRFRALTIVACPITEPPVLTGLTALEYLLLADTELTAAPDVTGLAALSYVVIGNAHLAEVDSIINTIAATCPHDIYGTLDVSGEGNAPVTEASAAAIEALTSPNGNWNLSYNE